jgi:YD repeat-containing protein
MLSRLARLLPAVTLLATLVLLLSWQASGDALASQATGTSAAPSVSASGRYVAFESAAADLVSGDTNAKKDVFVGWLTATTDPLGRKTTYGYDRAGRPTSLRDPAGRTTTSGYDAAGRLTSVRYSSGTPKDTTYAYDRDGRLSAMTDATGRSSWDYDSLGRMVASTNARGQTLGYGYDVGDQLTSLDYPDALTALNKTTGAGLNPVATGTVRRGYDQDGHLTSVAD